MARASKTQERSWLALVEASREPSDPSTVLAAVKATVGTVMPCAAHRDQAAFVALQAVARAYGEGLKERRKRLSNALADLAEECSRIVGQPGARGAPNEPASWVTQDLFDR